jgi:hypothetical protein
MGTRQVHSTKPGNCRVDHHHNNRSNENNGRPWIPQKQGLDHQTDRETEATDSLLLPEIVGTERGIPELPGFLHPADFKNESKGKIVAFLCEYFVRCTSNEARWLGLNENLQPHFGLFLLCWLLLLLWPSLVKRKLEIA